jgi:hypothetical protein
MPEGAASPHAWHGTIWQERSVPTHANRGAKTVLWQQVAMQRVLWGGDV